MYNQASIYKGGGVYKTGGGGGGGGGEIIPEGYSKVYYLEFKSADNDHCFGFSINNLNSNDKYYLTLFINSASAGTSTFRILEVRKDNNFVAATANINGVTNYSLFAIRALYYGIDINLPVGNLQLDFIESGKVRVNGTDQTLTNGTFVNGNLNYFLDHEPYKSPERLNGTKFFKFRITDFTDKIKYNFIPVVNNNTGVAYILETVTGVLKTNNNWISGPIIE